MSRGLSQGQRQMLGILVAAHRPLHVTGELGPLVGMPPTPSGTRSLIAAVRSLERRGLVAVTTTPRPGGGQPLLNAAANDGAAGELTGADVQRGQWALEATPAPPKVTDTARGQGKAKPPKSSQAAVQRLTRALELPADAIALRDTAAAGIPSDWQARADITEVTPLPDGSVTVHAAAMVTRPGPGPFTDSPLHGVAMARWQMTATPIRNGQRTDYQPGRWRVARGATGVLLSPSYFRRQLKVALTEQG